MCFFFSFFVFFFSVMFSMKTMSFFKYVFFLVFFGVVIGYGVGFLSFGGSVFFCFFFLMNQSMFLSMDFFSLGFDFLLFFVGGCIIFYSSWYFLYESNYKMFIFYMLFFMFFMFLLTNTTSLFFILLGWEGVGIMSFLLISWWFGRSEATQGGYQAIIYNRLGDFGFYISLMLCFMYGFNKDMFFVSDFFFGSFVTVFLIVSIMAKSSQFFFHPWLPNAMEGPTPVSSLLHSSTMVVAGVFLSIRISEYFNFFFLEFLMFIGAVTMLFGSLCGIGQFDIKKIIAFSTTSQLGFMLLIVSVGGYKMSFFLLCMHAFFKSALFMGSGVFIHFKNNDQFVTKMGSGFFFSKLTSLCFFVSSLSLMGFPFLSGFFSKDLILENVWGPLLNRFCVFVFIFASSLTVVYTLRIFLLAYAGAFSDVMSGKYGLLEVFGSNVSWIFCLCFGGVFFGLFSFNFFFLNNEEEFLPFFLKFTPVLILCFGVFFSFMVVLGDFSFFGSYLYFFNPIFHRLFVFQALFFVNIYVFFELFFFEFFLKCVFLSPINFFSKFFPSFFSFSKFFFFFFFLSFFLFLF
uniref:NADH:ubiquinone reductase (H(+)-translocating) n=1 Tax=Rhopalaea idoneta TaxID=1712670 RepID=A0A173QSX7_9ASCI|nr:NADH dehydrogenase subunit 5 [Rhopalaea idoneta]